MTTAGVVIARVRVIAYSPVATGSCTFSAAEDAAVAAAATGAAVAVGAAGTNTVVVVAEDTLLLSRENSTKIMTIIQNPARGKGRVINPR